MTIHLGRTGRHGATHLLLGTVVALGVVASTVVAAQPADAYNINPVEASSNFAGFLDRLNLDVCWNESLPPMWVEATRRALAAWNDATTVVRFRSLRPVSAETYAPLCDVYVSNELSDFDTPLPAPVGDSAAEATTATPLPGDGVIDAAESVERARGGRFHGTFTANGAEFVRSNQGFVKINTRSHYLQGTTAADLDTEQSVIVHELGHVLGLDHTQEENWALSVMGPTKISWLVPQADDLAGLDSIYSRVRMSTPAAAPYNASDPVYANPLFVGPITSITEAYWSPAPADISPVDANG